MSIGHTGTFLDTIKMARRQADKNLKNKRKIKKGISVIPNNKPPKILTVKEKGTIKLKLTIERNELMSDIKKHSKGTRMYLNLQNKILKNELKMSKLKR